MICDIMPTLSEDGDIAGEGSMEDNNFEQLMVNMLDERDKLMETLRETQENLTNTKSTLRETELERDTLLHQFELVLNKCELDRDPLIKKLSSYDGQTCEESIISRLKQQKMPLAEEFVTVAKELYQYKERMLERNEEISELKAERSNTKLLLEHLESLVSRHERSLRMTVVKRQAQSSAGVSSEVEVLKALKSLFEHHKALDEKVRERLRMAVEKANSLDEELAAANQEIDHLQQEIEYARERRRTLRNESGETIPNGQTESDTNSEELHEEIRELKYQLEKSRKEAHETKERFSSLEEQINNTTKKANFSVENNQRVQKELNEALAQKSDLEERMMTLEKRYVRSQNDLSAAADDAEKLKAEILSLQSVTEQRDEKISSLQEQCQFYEMKCSQSMKHAEELPKIQEELENRKAALNAAEERNFTAEEQLQNLQFQLEETSTELSRSKDRERMTEDHNGKLQSTVDKLLAESNDRLQQHLKEKMQSIDEKALVAQELEKAKSTIESMKKSMGALETEIEKLRKETNKYRNQPLNYLDFGSSTSFGLPKSPEDSFTPASEPTWQKMNQANVVSNVSKNLVPLPKNEFDGGLDMSSSAANPDSIDALTSNDAQKLANVLQQQLDAINEELAMLQVEHRNTASLTEEIEKRVGSETNSLDEMSIGSSSKGSIDKQPADDKKSMSPPYIKLTPSEQILRTRADLDLRRQSDEGNLGFQFSSYDPVDTKPLMLKAGRSQEVLNDAEGDAPSSQPSDSTGSEGSIRCKGMTIPWSSYESDSYLDYSSNASSLGSSMESLSRRGGKNKGLKNSIGKIFGTKGKLKPRDAMSTSRGEDLDSSTVDVHRDAETRMKKKLLEDVISSGSSFAAWNAPTILAWLELWVKLPEWYIQACRANVKSGSIMSALSDYEIQHEIGVNNPLHRAKLRLAIREMINVTSPISPPTAKTSLVFGDMNHFWIASEWLSSLGLPQYKYAFIDNLVDARMLEHITKKDYTKYLKVVDSFHRVSMSCGTKCLEVLNYDRKYLEKRRKDCESDDKDVLVWSNTRVIKWTNKIGLEDYADFLRQSGVHGALIALDENFDLETFAYYLQIPSTNEKARNLLEKEYNKLLILCHEYKTSLQPDLGDGDFKRSKSWRKKFKKEKLSSKDKNRSYKEDTLKRQNIGEGVESDATSPGRKQRKSPNMERKMNNMRGGLS